MATSTEIYVAKDSFATTLDGESIIIQKGITRVRAGHKLLKRFAGYFEPLEIHYDVEQATARPAETRGGPKPAARPEPEPAKAEPTKAEPVTAEPEAGKV